jgi:hypothetical protein
MTVNGPDTHDIALALVRIESANFKSNLFTCGIVASLVIQIVAIIGVFVMISH